MPKYSHADSTATTSPFVPLRTIEGRRLLTMSEAARAYGVGVNRIRELVHEGHVPSYAVGSRPRLLPEELDAYFTSTPWTPGGDAA